MAKVNWTFLALEDLDAAAEYLASYSEKYASYFIDLVFEKSKILENFPFAGRIVPESNISSIRELIIKNYRIIYSVPDSDNVQILAVRHSAKPLSDIIEPPGSA